MAETIVRAPAGLPARLDELLAATRDRLAEAGIADAALEARLIVEHFTGFGSADRISAPRREVPCEQAQAVLDATERRRGGEPVFRIIGRRPFHGVELAVSPSVLDPRPDTEALIDLALPFARAVAAGAGDCRILDLGTGSGAIALALLAACPRARALGTDICQGALEMAAANAELNGVADRFATCRADWLDGIDARFHLIVSNPPYIRSNDIAGLSREVRDFDPRLALDGGADGLDAYRRIAAGAASRLEPGGQVFVEIGHDQAQTARDVFAGAAWRPVGQASDLAGHVRALSFAPAAAEFGPPEKGLGKENE